MSFRVAISATLAVSAVSSIYQGQTIFRAETRTVLVDVSVTEHGRPVTGLVARDFRVLDNGVSQHVDQAVVRSMSLDVTLLLDTSGSVWTFGDRLVTAANETLGMLERDDRAELIAFDNQLRRTNTVQTDGAGRAPVRIMDGGTVLFDAVCAAAMEPVEAGQRHLIVALTDGLDTQSLLTRSQRQGILKRTNAIVYVVAISIRGRALQGRIAVGAESAPYADYDYLLKELTELTGGMLIDLRPGGSISDAMQRALRASRTRYLLSYEPTNARGSGWHDLSVTVPGHDYQVNARRGYFDR